VSKGKRGGGIHGFRLRGNARLSGLAWARRWREQHRAEFDAMDAAGAFLDSVRTEWPLTGAAE